MDNNSRTTEQIKIIEKIGKYEIEVVMNKKLYELQVIPEELYQTVTDKLLSKIKNLKEELELIEIV